MFYTFNTFSVKLVLTCQFPNALPRAVISFFKKILIYFFFKKIDSNTVSLRFSDVFRE